MHARVFYAWLLLSFLAAGCEEPRHVGGPQVNPAASSSEGGSTPAQVAAAPETPKEASHGEILGQRTQDIRQLAPEEQKKTEAAPTQITARDPITLSGNAYVVAIGQIAVGNIKHAMDLYNAENGRYPASYDEFMNEIVRKNNIALPMLPSYQEYFYDEKGHKLQVREYPDRKAGAHPGGR
jgi:hypothetical protein